MISVISKNSISIATILLLSGCSNFSDTAKSIRDPNMTTGCYVTTAGATFDSYFDTTKGSVTTCKLVCSKDLPKNFSYSYDSGNCKVKIGANDSE